MQIEKTTIADVFLLQPKVFGDERGFFLESFNQRKFTETTGVTDAFVQDNHSRSGRGVLRGLHYQIQQPQGKLVRVTQGEVLDVVVDMRRQSPTFGQHVGVVLSGTNHKQLWVPKGFAHGFFVRSETADFLYKTTDYYAPQFECSLLWNDSALNIDWQMSKYEQQNIQISVKDAQGVPLATALCFE